MARKEKDLDFLNDVTRSRAGLRPVVPKLRRCMLCNDKFWSYGSAHRRCDKCKRRESEIEGSLE